MHLASLIFDFLGLLDDQIFTSNVRISFLKSNYRVKFSAVVFLVQIHAVRKHFFEITDLDGHVGGKFTAIYFNSSWVNI